LTHRRAVATSILVSINPRPQPRPTPKPTGAPAPAVIRTNSRASVVLPDFLRCVFFVHAGGKRLRRIEVTEGMVGHKLGEFAPTRVQPQHKKKGS
jgi:ribosomal protein S19